MRWVIILALVLAGCRANESTTRGDVDNRQDNVTTGTDTARGAIETAAEQPAGPDSNVDTSATTTQPTSAPPP